MTAQWLGVELDQLPSAADAGIDGEDADEALPPRQSRAQASSGAVGSIGCSAAMEPGLPMSITPLAPVTLRISPPCWCDSCKAFSIQNCPRAPTGSIVGEAITLLSGTDGIDRTPSFAP